MSWRRRDRGRGARRGPNPGNGVDPPDAAVSAPSAEVATPRLAREEVAPAPRPIRAVSAALEIAGAFMMAGILVVTFAQAIFRYFLGWSFPGSHELVRVTFVYMIAVGAAVAYERGENLRAPLLWHQSARTYGLALALLCAALLWATIRLVDGLGHRGASLLGIPDAVLYWPIGGFAVFVGVLALSTLRPRR